MNFKRILPSLLASFFCLVSCSPKDAKKETTVPTVRIALCQQSMLEDVAQSLCKHFEGRVEFEFTLANNSVEYYEYLDEHNDLPDILTVRRFSLLDSLPLKSKLVDLSTTSLASSYYQNYLNGYTYSDGTVTWLPSTAEAVSILANKTLFEKNNIAIPTDYASFKAACTSFKALGIEGFTTDWKYDYSSLEILEGANIETLQSFSGKQWRRQYESGLTKEADSEIWSDIFKNVKDFLTDTGNIGETYATQGTTAVTTQFKQGKVAMIRGGGSELVGYNANDDGNEFIILPYFGATEAENWMLTYPSFQAAISRNSRVDSTLLMEIYSYMLGQDSADSFSSKGTVISYSSNVRVELNEDLKSLEKYINSNQMFIRFTSNNLFSAAQEAVLGMVKGTYDETTALNAFNAGLKKETTITKDLNFEKGYSYRFTSDHGSQASSALLNSERSVWNTEEHPVDIAVAYSTSLSNSIYEGGFASSQIAYLYPTNLPVNYYMELTGEKVKKLISAMLSYEVKDEEAYHGMKPKNVYGLPVTSGCKMAVSQNGDSFSLTDLFIDGSSIDETKTYRLVFSITAYYASFIAKQAGIDLSTEATTSKVPTTANTLKQFLVTDKSQFVEPSDYIELTEVQK